MNNNELNKIGVGIVIMSLSASTYASGLERYNPFDNNLISIPTHIDENLFPKQISPSIKLLDSKNDAIAISSDEDEYYCHEEYDAIEIPIVKTVKVKFNKPIVKKFEI